MAARAGLPCPEKVSGFVRFSITSSKCYGHKCCNALQAEQSKQSKSEGEKKDEDGVRDSVLISI
jgi:hypothetical protein